MPPINTLLFDLDGTLLDTAPDLVAAVNQVLLHEDRPALPLAQLRPFVSGGASVLLRRAFGDDRESPLFQRRLQHMLDYYLANIAVHTRLFDGMSAILEYLESQNIPWGIVTNKPGWLTNPLLDALGLAERSSCTISGDTVAQKKPHPLPMLEACRRLDRPPEHCVYVGDDSRDIQAGRAAGMLTLAAVYGYVPEGDDPRCWGADGLLQAPDEILPWLAQRGAVT
ncbi:MAG: phosphoglycolate phosphatase [Methylococcaceae bacterium]|nr:MAG: phosphoglycolate phosphatase [Methylococcaceae bacterium]